MSPIEEPKLAQDMGIRVDGEVVVEYNKRTEHITPPFAEQDLTNLLVRLTEPMRSLLCIWMDMVKKPCWPEKF